MKQKQINYPEIKTNDIKVLGRVVSITSANKVAAAELVFDERFDYDRIGSYAWDNIIDATGSGAGMDQYTINRLFGKKLKKWDEVFELDEEGWILELKVRNLIADNATINNKLTTKDLKVTNNADINNLHVSGDSIFDGNVNIAGNLIVNNNNITDKIDQLFRIVSGEDKTSSIWQAITALQTWKTTVDADLSWLKEKVNYLLQCCEDMQNRPQGGIILNVNPESIDFTVGDPDIALSASTTPQIVGSATFTSNDTSVCTIVNGNKAHAVAEGSTTITVTLGDYTRSIPVIVHAPAPVTYIVRFNSNNGVPAVIDNQTVTEGNKAIAPQVTRDGYTLDGWHIETLSGNVWDFNTPVTSNLNLIAGWTENEQPVEPISPDSISISGPNAVQVGNTITLTATITPSNADTDTAITWSSSDESKATVNNGVVTGVAEGDVVITATTANGRTATHNVTVNPASTPQEPEEPVELTYTIIFKDCSPEHNFTIGDNSFDQYAVVVDTQTYHAGDTVTPPNEAAVKAALTSAGASWSRPYDNLVGWNNLPYGQIMPAEDITVYAIWELHQENPTAGYRLVIKPDFSNQPETDPDWSQDGNDYVLHQGGTGLVTLWAQNTEDLSDEYTVSGTWTAIGENESMISVNGQGTFCTFTTNGAGSSETKTVTIQATHPDFANATITITLSPVSQSQEPETPVVNPDDYIVQFDHNAWNIYGSFAPVYVEVTLADGYPEDIIWTSSNRNVAIVEPENYGTNRQEGCIYAVGSGSAVIRGTGVLSGKYDEVAVTVELLNLSYDKVTVNMDTDSGSDRKELPSATLGENNTPVSISEWTSSDESVATVYTQQSPSGTVYKINPVAPGICKFEARYYHLEIDDNNHNNSHNHYANVVVIVKQSENSNTEGTLVELSPYHAVLSNGQSQTITASTIGVDLANDYEWVLKAYPQNMVTITPSAGNSSCTVTASNTPGFAEIWLKPISDNDISTHVYGPGLIKAGTIIEVQ